MNNDTIKFARFVFFFHWLACALSMFAVWVVHNHKPQTDILLPLIFLPVGALLVWQTSRDEHWGLEDIMWRGASIMWGDAVVAIGVPMLLYFGVRFDEFTHGTPFFVAGFIALLPGLVSSRFRR